MDELNVRPNEKTPIMATDTNTFQFRPSHTRIRWIVVGMFLLGLPVAGLMHFTPVEGHMDPLKWKVKVFGTGVWMLWLLRAAWHTMPNILRISLWVISSVWHSLFVPLFPFALFHPIPAYLAIHCLLMLALSLHLLRYDRASESPPSTNDH